MLCSFINLFWYTFFFHYLFVMVEPCWCHFMIGDCRIAGETRPVSRPHFHKKMACNGWPSIERVSFDEFEFRWRTFQSYLSLFFPMYVHSPFHLSFFHLNSFHFNLYLQYYSVLVVFLVSVNWHRRRWQLSIQFHQPFCYTSTIKESYKLSWFREKSILNTSFLVLKEQDVGFIEIT